MIDLKKTACAVFVALAMAAPASAHDTYFLPNVFVSETAAPVDITLTSAAKFPAIEFGPKAARILKLEASDGTIAVDREEKTALHLKLTPKGEGLIVVAANFGPRDIDLKPDEVAEHLEEVGAGPSLRQAYEALPQPRLWKETYTKYAKTLLCVKTCTPDAAQYKPVGHALEFVPVATDPAHQRLDGTVGFKLLHHGQPIVGQPVAITNAKGDRILRPTDAQGVVQIEVRLYPPVLLSAVVIDPPKAPGGRFTSDFATLTFMP